MPYYVSSGQSSNGLVASGDDIEVNFGGKVNNTTVKNGGTLEIYSGGTAKYTAVSNGGEMCIFGGVASSTTINSGGSMELIEGTAYNTSVYRNGEMRALGGFANTVYVANGAYFSVGNGFSGGWAANVTLEEGAYCSFNVTPDTYVIGSYAGSPFSISGMVSNFIVRSNCWLGVTGGGVASNITILDGGEFSINSGGKLTGQTSVTRGATVFVCGGGIIDFDISSLSPGAAPRISDFSRFTDSTYQTVLSADFTLTIYDLQENGTYTLANGVSQFSKTISVYNRSGSRLGSLSVGQTSSIGGYNYTLNLANGSLSVTKDGTGPDGYGCNHSFTSAYYLGSDTSIRAANGASIAYSGEKDYYSFTLTQSATVTLATNGDAGGDTVLCLYDGDQEWIDENDDIDEDEGLLYSMISRTLGPGTYYAGIGAYSTIGNYSLSINVKPIEIDRTPPTINISASVTTPTNQDVTVYASFSDNDGVSSKLYKIENGSWQNYTGGITVSENTTIYFKAADNSGNQSETYYTVSNIDKKPPAAPVVTVNPSSPKCVLVWATFSEDTVTKQCSFDGETWETYTSTLFFDENGIVYFRGIDAAGNVSKIIYCVVNSIDTIPPARPVASASITTPTNQDVTVGATFSEDTETKQYSFDELTWQPYTSAITFKENGVVYFRGTDAAENVSDVTSYVVDNIDKTPPAKPVASASITTPTKQDVTVGATFSEDTETKQYSFDGSTWQPYTSAITFTENGVVYFRGTDAAGNVSERTSYAVNNIDKTPPSKPAYPGGSRISEGLRHSDRDFFG